MKIVLAALNAKYVHSNLAVYYLEAYAKSKIKTEDLNQIEISVKEYTINHNLNMILQSIYKEKADIVAFSCYIWNIHEVLTIARELSKVAEKTRIWLGGPEVSYDSEKQLMDNEFVEGIIRGEGEETFYELALLWLKGEFSYSGIKGITFRDREGRICSNESRAPISMNDVPFVYNDLSRFKNKVLYYETSRGCPFSCSYCLSSVDKTVRFKSMPLVEKELQFFLDHNVPQVKFIDRTFNCNKERALLVWSYIKEHDNGVTNFHFEVAADLIGEEELKLFEGMRPGLIQLEIGLQSTYLKTIKEIRRKMDVDKVKNTLLRIHGLGNIHQHLDLIAGLPYEDFLTFKESFNVAYEMKPAQLQLGFLKVLKGSYMSEHTEEYGIKYQEHQPYEVLSTKWISYDEILVLKNVEEMVEVYHNSGQFVHTLKYILSFFRMPFDLFEALGDYYVKYDLFGIGFKREARYEALRSFCREYFKNTETFYINKTKDFSAIVLDNLLTFDYYLRENVKRRPAWSKGEPIEKHIYLNFFKMGGTEEVYLSFDGYDSKAAARTMHIEPICSEALPWIFDTVSLGTGSDKEAFENVKECYCLFDYNARNPLSQNAYVTLLKHL